MFVTFLVNCMPGFRNFCQRGSKFDLVRGEGGSKYHYKQAIIGLPAKRHGWRADDGPTLNAGLVAL